MNRRVIAWFAKRGADVSKLTDWTAVAGDSYYVEGAGEHFDLTSREFAAFARAVDEDERDDLREFASWPNSIEMVRHDA